MTCSIFRQISLTHSTMDVRLSDEWLRVPAKTTNSKNKKAMKTPFWFFMMEEKRRLEQEGKWDDKKTMEELVQATIPIWKQNKTDPGFLAPYIEQHRLWKMNRSKNLENVFDSLGKGLWQILRGRLRE